MTKRYIPAALALTLFFTAPALAEEQKPAPAAVASLDGKIIKGKVLETHSAGGYTYLLIEGDLGKNWAAIPESKVEVDQERHSLIASTYEGEPLDPRPVLRKGTQVKAFATNKTGGNHA